MATRNKLKGVAPEALAKLANEGGQKHAAAVMGVTQPAISFALRKAGYEPTTTWRLRAQKEQEIAS